MVGGGTVIVDVDVVVDLVVVDPTRGPSTSRRSAGRCS
jgi:hypothetical protein